MEWCGVIKSSSFSKDERKLRKEFTRSIKEREWERVFTILEERQELINFVFLDNSSWYAPIHYLTSENFPVEIIEKFINLGAWRTLKTFDGEMAIDIANRKGYHHLVELLKPVYLHNVDFQILTQIQKLFHQVIVGRISVIDNWQSLRLPELEVLLEIERQSVWFPVPGMYGGFDYNLIIKDNAVKLISDSWIRVVGGSEERHEITSDGIKLIKQPSGSEFHIIKQGSG